MTGIKQLFIISGISICSFAVLAHEEPAKTMKEKEIKEQSRKEILDKKILSSTVWKHQIHESLPDSVTKERFLTVVYDLNGNISEMQVYKRHDTLDYKVVFGYDENNNMVTDTDYNPDGTIVENIEYEYDEFGRVKGQMNYLDHGIVDSRFTYDVQRNILLLSKYNPLDSLEYEIIYKYEGLVDNSNNLAIIKQKPGGSLMLRVENIFNDHDQRLQKKIFDQNDQLLYYFGYTYFENSSKFSSISKYTPQDQLISTTTYTLNDIGLVGSVVTTDDTGNIMSYSSYEYHR